jgi:proline iminopeptidase
MNTPDRHVHEQAALGRQLRYQFSLTLFSLLIVGSLGTSPTHAVSASTNIAAEPSTSVKFFPPPLKDDWTDWITGEWEGTAEGNAGKGKGRTRFELALGGQFLISHGQAEITGLHPDYLKKQLHATEAEIERFKRSGYQALEIYTIDQKTGEVIGYLFDSLRCLAIGRGHREGGRETIEWEWRTGHKSTRVTERVSADNMRIVERTPNPDGTVTEDRGEMTRIRLTAETVLDRRVHIEPGILEVPAVRPLCAELNLEKRHVQAGNCALHCETEGQGLPLVLINGGPGATHHGFHPYFHRAGGFAKVVYYDQRGCGQSDYHREEGYTVDQAVTDLDQLRQGLGFDRWVVLGWSYGGVLAESYTIKHPERVAGLVLVGASDDGMHLTLQPTRQYDFISTDERNKIAAVHNSPSLSLAQIVFNAHLNGDWKRQQYYRPTREELARTALYGWKHDPVFRREILQDLAQLDLRGLFKGCPVPILLLEGQHDLTWGADKPEKFARCFPGSRLVLFEASAHAPFADEPDKFFAAIREFIGKLPAKLSGVDQWRQQIAARQADQRRSPEYLILHSRWGQASSERIARGYSAECLPRLSDPGVLLRLGFALYDAKRYSEALVVFRRMEPVGDPGVALVWQGHMLDLLGQREESVATYRKALTMELGTQHDQYGIILSKDYVEQRLKTPFSRARNRLAD